MELNTNGDALPESVNKKIKMAMNILGEYFDTGLFVGTLKVEGGRWPVYYGTFGNPYALSELLEYADNVNSQNGVEEEEEDA